MWTSATVLRLVEEGRISLSDTIDRYLPAELVERVHVMEDGVSRGREITMRMMLNHTSGIYNYSTDDRWVAEVGAQPRKEWTAEQLVEWAIDNGTPDFKPGEGWHYNDTAYALLTIILKRLTGEAHPAVYRDMLPMHTLPDTYVEKLEQPPAGAREKAHQYFIAADMNLWDPSFDTWGGGGLVTTGRDQARFIRALFEGRVYEKPGTLRTMRETVDGLLTLPGATEPDEVEYGLGIERIVHDGIECWYHTGAWGVYLYYCPALDLAFAGAFNQYQDKTANDRYLARRIVEIVKAAPAETLKLRVIRVARRRVEFRTTAGPFRIGGVRITLAGSRAITGEDGQATLRPSRRLRPRHYRARACKTGFRCVTTRVRARRR